MGGAVVLDAMPNAGAGTRGDCRDEMKREGWEIGRKLLKDPGRHKDGMHHRDMLTERMNIE
jgi:hypothetical protein